MRRQSACFAIAFLVLVSPESGAQPFATTTCPQKIDVEQRVAALPEGWEAGQATGTVVLVSVAFFDGPPAKQAALKYDSEDRQKRDRVAFWNLPPGARGYWISCGYANTTAVISRRLPDSIRNCAVTYEPRKRGAAGPPAIKNITCR
ncbi:MAG: STY0301 family protein [Burkholderiales bacterium]